MKRRLKIKKDVTQNQMYNIYTQKKKEKQNHHLYKKKKKKERRKREKERRDEKKPSWVLSTPKPSQHHHRSGLDLWSIRHSTSSAFGSSRNCFSR